MKYFKGLLLISFLFPSVLISCGSDGSEKESTVTVEKNVAPPVWISEGVDGVSTEQYDVATVPQEQPDTVNATRTAEEAVAKEKDSEGGAEEN